MFFRDPPAIYGRHNMSDIETGPMVPDKEIFKVFYIDI